MARSSRPELEAAEPGLHNGLAMRPDKPCAGEGARAAHADRSVRATRSESFQHGAAALADSGIGFVFADVS